MTRGRAPSSNRTRPALGSVAATLTVARRSETSASCSSGVVTVRRRRALLPVATSRCNDRRRTRPSSTHRWPPRPQAPEGGPRSPPAHIPRRCTRRSGTPRWRARRRPRPGGQATATRAANRITHAATEAGCGHRPHRATGSTRDSRDHPLATTAGIATRAGAVTTGGWLSRRVRTEMACAGTSPPQAR
jgi:hypothetical protein